jgi:hypothetical protein
MDIGRPQRVRVLEPLEDPIRREAPPPPSAPPQPQPEPEPVGAP